MNKLSISDNLVHLLKLNGDMSLSELSRVTSIPQPTLHHILEGKTKKPRRHALETLANFFSISVSQLTGAMPFSHNIPDSIKQGLKISTIPLIPWNLASTWSANAIPQIEFEEIILNSLVDKSVFALRLNNNSMEPLFQNKSILVFDPTKAPKERDFVLVHLADTNEPTFNRLFIEDNNHYIKINKCDGNAELIKINPPNDKIIATLIEARLTF